MQLQRADIQKSGLSFCLAVPKDGIRWSGLGNRHPYQLRQLTGP